MTHPLLSDAVVEAVRDALHKDTHMSPNGPVIAGLAAALKALSAAGYVVVPKEPTQEMLMAAAMDDAYDFGWEAMLAAAEGV